MSTRWAGGRLRADFLLVVRRRHRLARSAAVSWPLVLLFTLAGCTESSPSGPQPPVQCAYAVTPTEADINAPGGSVAIQVSTSAACAWTASSGVSWMAVTAGQTGTGNGTVAVTVQENTGETPRTGTLTIGGTTVTIRQAGTPAPCAYMVTVSTDDFSAAGGQGTVQVATTASCAWQAVSQAAWISFTGGTTGTGSGQVTFTVAPNPETVGRTGAMTVAGHTVAIDQDGDTAACEYRVEPVTLFTCMSWSQDLVSQISTQAGCPWTAASTAGWMTVVEGESGSGPGTIRLRGDANYDARRSAILQVRWPTVTAGQNVVVDQAGCTYGVSATAMAFTSSGGAGRFDVLQQSDPYECGGPLQNACVWSAVANAEWITITNTMPRTGDDPVLFAVAPNAASTARTGTITVRSRTVTITQAGAPNARSHHR